MTKNIYDDIFNICIGVKSEFSHVSIPAAGGRIAKTLLAEVIRSALEDEALGEALSTRLKDMKARLERLSDRAERKRQLALRVMSEAEIQKLTAPDLTASLKQGAPTLEVRDDAVIPAVYWKPQPSKLDRQGLLASLKAGVAIEGVALSSGEVQLSVRTK